MRATPRGFEKTMANMGKCPGDSTPKRPKSSNKDRPLKEACDLPDFHQEGVVWREPQLARDRLADASGPAVDHDRSGRELGG